MRRSAAVEIADRRFMDLRDLLSLEAVLPAVRAISKKQVLQEVAARAGRVSGLDDRAIFETISQRERLGSTGVGHGIAIPHGSLPGLERPFGIFARLVRPIEFDAIDDLPVDLVFALLTPEGAGADHLKALARISRVMRDHALAGKLRASSDTAALWALLTHPVHSDAA